MKMKLTTENLYALLLELEKRVAALEPKAKAKGSDK